MHPDQQARLAILCASDPENCDKYRAAACALTDCGTDLPDGDPYKSFLMDLEILGKSDEYKIARDILNDNGFFDKRSGQNVFGRIGEWGLFTLTYYLDREYWNREYIEEKRGAFGTWSDYQNAWLMRHDEGVTRAMGGASVGIGGASILGGSASMETSPCLSSFMIASGILLYKGGSDMLLGDYQSSLGADIYNSLNKPWESHLGFDLTAQRQLEAALAILDLGALKTLTKVLPKGKSGFVEMPANSGTVRPSLSKEQQKLLDLLHKIELGKDTGKSVGGTRFILDEAKTGILLEEKLGIRLSRSIGKEADWVNKANGLRYDGCSPPLPEHFNPKFFKKSKDSLNRHLSDTGSDVIVVDLKTRRVTGQNAQLVKDHIASLENPSKKIIIIE